MVWAKLDDAILDNQKIARAGVLGFALHVAAITWCCRNLTDGFIPYARAEALFSVEQVKDELAAVSLTAGCAQAAVSLASDALGDLRIRTLDVAKKLVDVGLWREDEERSGFWLKDFLEFNPSREQVENKRKKASKPKPDDNLPSAGEQAAGSLPSDCAQAAVSLTADCAPPGSRIPDPDPHRDLPPNAGAGAREVGVEPDPPPRVRGLGTPVAGETLTPKRRAIVASIEISTGQKFEVDLLWEKFVAKQKSDGKWSSDWDEAWRFWCIDEAKFQKNGMAKARGRRGPAPPQRDHAPPAYEQTSDADLLEAAKKLRAQKAAAAQ